MVSGNITISTQEEWNAFFTSDGIEYISGTATITQDIEFDAQPNRPILKTGTTLEGDGFTLTIGYENHNGFAFVNGGTIQNINAVLYNNTLTNQKGLLNLKEYKEGQKQLSKKLKDEGLLKKEEHDNNKYLELSKGYPELQLALGTGSVATNGGGILAVYTSGSTTFSNSSLLRNCSFNGNLTNDYSGGISGSHQYTIFSDLTIENCSMNGIKNGFYSGGIVGPYGGKNGNLNVRNCWSTGDLENLYSCGICGATAGESGVCIIENSYFIGDINSLSGGGITRRCGLNGGSCTILNCYFYGNINSDASGGICGSVAGYLGNCSIKNCYSLGDLNGYQNGGICGAQAGQEGGNCIIENCFYIGNINQQYSGGIVGLRPGYIGSCTISNCYSFGIPNTTDCGGLLGGLVGDGNGTVTISNCYVSNEFTETNYGITPSVLGTLNINKTIYLNGGNTYGSGGTVNVETDAIITSLTNITNSIGDLPSDNWITTTDDYPRLKVFTEIPWVSVTYNSPNNQPQLYNLNISQALINSLTEPLTLPNGTNAYVSENLLITNENQYFILETGAIVNGQNKYISYQPENYMNLFRGDTSGVTNNVIEYYYLVNIKNTSLPVELFPNQTGKIIENLKIQNETDIITLSENSIIDGQGYQVSILSSSFSGLFLVENQSVSIKNISLIVSDSTTITNSALMSATNSNLTILGINMKCNLTQDNTGGFIGDADGVTATLTNCYHLGKVLGNTAGGFFGVNALNCSLTYGYHIGEVGTNSGGISGSNCNLSFVYSEGPLIAGSTDVIPDTYSYVDWNDTDAQNAIGSQLGVSFFSFNQTIARSVFLNGQPWGLTYFTKTPYTASKYPSANSLAVNCILEGMKVLIEEFGKRKYLKIENIRSGDMVVTPHGLKKVLRVGRVWYDGSDETNRPVLIPKDYFMTGLPMEDTYVSAKHHFVYDLFEEENKVLKGGKLRKNKMWYKGEKIGQEVDLNKLFIDKKGVYYYHLVIENNATFYVNNLQSESIAEFKFRRNFEELKKELEL